MKLGGRKVMAVEEGKASRWKKSDNSKALVEIRGGEIDQGAVVEGISVST